MSTPLPAFFSSSLTTWFPSAARDLPWRRTRDPYHIWLSEVMLQQTRVDQALPYYERFLAAFPTLKDLASANLDAVLRCWEGLGYYSRARHFHRAAALVMARHQGQIPADYPAFRALPGVGPYTAAAVLSIAFGLPYAVLDGNVIRVLTRFFAVRDDVKATATRKRLQALADALLDPAAPGLFNEAVMELGATVCTPSAPSCGVCPLQPACRAAALGTQEAFPVSRKKAPIPHYDVAVGLIFDAEGKVFIQRRPEDGLLGGLWEFPGGKREPGETPEDTCRRELREELGVEVAVSGCFHRLNHAYTHFKITLHAFLCRIRQGTPSPRHGAPTAWVLPADLQDYAFPRANRRLIERLLHDLTRPS